MTTPTQETGKPPQKTMISKWLGKAHPMHIRIVVGILGCIFYSGMVFIGSNGLVFALGVALFSIMGANEFFQAVKRQGGEPSEVIGFIACIIFQIAAWTHYRDPYGFAAYLPALLTILIISTLLAEMVKHRPRPIINVGATLLGSVYVGWLFSYLILLRDTNAPLLTPPIHGTTPGEWLIVFVTATTWLSDAGALFVGRGLGKHKLAPRISPAKTWEGSIGGLLMSLAGGLILGVWLHIALPIAAILAVLCGVAGQVGDLCESILKRDLGLKDFGTVFPGHGGVLDRVDSLLFSAPLAYYLVQVFLFNKLT